MESCGYHDDNIFNLLDRQDFSYRYNVNRLQMHSSLIRRLCQEAELKGHQGCVNAISWNTQGSLLISGSDDTKLNIWSYSGRKLLHSIDTGHSANIFCTKFVPETSDEVVASGAGDGEVRLFNLSRLRSRHPDDRTVDLSAVYRCHSRRVKKLAVESGNPIVVWSASEDGTLRQHDFRESSCCPPIGSSPQSCRSILLDLRSGAKRSLVDPPRQMLALKSCDISTSRPHLLLVGGSDAFARLYDRRMLPTLSSCRKFMSPPPCVNYLCPMHLSEPGRLNWHLTHVTFSPRGDEALLSYSGEHVYLMSIDGGKKEMKYTAGDASKLMAFTPILNGLELQSPLSDLRRENRCFRNTSPTLVKCRKLVDYAERCLQDDKDYYHGIEACNEVLDGHNHLIGSSLQYECHCIRAALLLRRKWKNDVHMAIRDCYNARRIDNSSYKALYYMSEALSQLGKQKEALDFAISSQCVAPVGTDLTEWVENVRKKYASDEAEKIKKTTDESLRSEGRSGRALSLSDILFRSDANSDASQEGARSEREDSDFEEELELNFEPSITDDEGHDVQSDMLRGCISLKSHRRSNSARESTSIDGSSGSPPSTQNGETDYQSATVIDMKQRYVGHCNVGTDIKQASFLGQKGDYVASGSDDGRWFIWEKKTGRLVKMLLGDDAVVNCVQCHPFDPVIATSGIDDTIKIWSPTAPVPSIVAGAGGPEMSNFLEAMDTNQRRLSYTREFVLPFELLERSRMLEFTDGALNPFECTQS